MPETNLAISEARQAKRDEIIGRILKEARNRASKAIKSTNCRAEQHNQCDGTHALASNECLCTCHDPATTYWAEWGNFRNGLEVAGMCSGPYGSAEEAIVDGFAESAGDAHWIREHSYVEEITEERWDALMDWDAKTEAEKSALRPNIETGSAS